MSAAAALKIDAFTVNAFVAIRVSKNLCKAMIWRQVVNLSQGVDKLEHMPASIYVHCIGIYVLHMPAGLLAKTVVSPFTPFARLYS